MGDHGPFAVEAYRSKGHDVIRLCGQLDLASAPMVEAILDRMWVIPDHLVVEVSGLDFVDSTGLKVLIRASQLVDGRIALVGTGTQLRLLLETTAMTDRFHVVTDPEAAHDLFRVRRAN
jgi:anti-anti-sigma factor